MHRNRRNFLKLSALAVGMMASGMALAGAHIDAALNRVLGTATALDKLEVVVSYQQQGAVNATQLQALRTLGIGKGIGMRNLPIAGALATPAQIRALAQRSDVRAIHLNRALEYYNQEARELSGVNRVQANPGDFSPSRR